MRLFILLVVCAGATTVLASSVHATIVADGRYAIYTGSADGTEIDFIGNGAASVGPAVSAQKFYFEMEEQRYVYVAVWAAPAAARGLLAEFLFNDLAVFSGDPAWEAYLVLGDPDIGSGAPSTSVLSQHVRRANRRFAWQKAALNGINAIGARRLVEEIGEKAAWMWRPVEASSGIPVEGEAPTAEACVVFRLSPNEIWPEIELWHGHNVGRGPLGGGGDNTNGGYRYLGGGGGGGGASSGGLPGLGTGMVMRVPNPFPNTAPPNSSSIPPQMTPSEPSNPILPPPPEKPERPKPPVPPPPVPEPSTAMLVLAGTGLLRRR